VGPIVAAAYVLTLGQPDAASNRSAGAFSRFASAQSNRALPTRNGVSPRPATVSYAACWCNRRNTSWDASVPIPSCGVGTEAGGHGRQAGQKASHRRGGRKLASCCTPYGAAATLPTLPATGGGGGIAPCLNRGTTCKTAVKQQGSEQVSKQSFQSSGKRQSIRVRVTA